MLYVNPHTATAFAGKDMAPGTEKREAEALREFEQLFVYQMLKEMRKTIPNYGVVDSPQRAYFDEMMDDFLAGEMARSGQFGIAEQLQNQLAIHGAQSGTEKRTSAGIEVDAATPGIPLDSHSPAGFSVSSRHRGYKTYAEGSHETMVPPS